MKSGFGKAVESGIARAMAPGYDNPIEKAMKAYAVEVCDKLLRERFATQIESAISAMLSEQITSEMIEKVSQAAVTKMIAAASDRY